MAIPSSLQVMGVCRLRFAFRQARPHSPTSGTPATQLGQLCHRVLQIMVDQRAFWDASWLERLGTFWDRELEVLVSGLGANSSDWGPPQEWPDYQLKKARLKRMSARLRTLVTAEPPDTHFLSEEPVQGASDNSAAVLTSFFEGRGAIESSTSRRGVRSMGLPEKYTRIMPSS